MNEDSALVDAGSDHERGVGVARLVEAQALANSGVVPNAVGIFGRAAQAEMGSSRPRRRRARFPSRARCVLAGRSAAPAGRSAPVLAAAIVWSSLDAPLLGIPRLSDFDDSLRHVYGFPAKGAQLAGSQPRVKAVAQIARSGFGRTASRVAAEPGVTISTSRRSGTGSSRSRVGLTGTPSRARARR